METDVNTATGVVKTFSEQYGAYAFGTVVVLLFFFAAALAAKFMLIPWLESNRKERVEARTAELLMQREMREADRTQFLGSISQLTGQFLDETRAQRAERASMQQAVTKLEDAIDKQTGAIEHLTERIDRIDK